MGHDFGLGTISGTSWATGASKCTEIRICGDRWLSMGILHGPKAWDELVMVVDLIDPLSHTWNQSLLQRFFGDQIIKEVCTIPVRPQYAEDQLVWSATPNGQHTVKSNYYAIVQSISNPNRNAASSSHQNPRFLWRRIWAMKTAPKIRLFIWSLCQNALASKANLFQRHIIADPLCHLCK